VASPQLDVGDRQATSGSVREGARLGVWLMEEWLRQAVATYHVLRGHIVLFDRHFFADYYHADVDRRQVRRSLPRRLHGWMLRHAYPKPDVTVMLDAPSQRLYERKPEASPEWLEQRRRQYLELADVVPTFFVIDSDRPFDTVVSEVAELIAKVAEDRT
jgi:thymidylate kinase